MKIDQLRRRQVADGFWTPHDPLAYSRGAARQPQVIDMQHGDVVGARLGHREIGLRLPRGEVRTAEITDVQIRLERGDYVLGRRILVTVDDDDFDPRIPLYPDRIQG